MRVERFVNISENAEIYGVFFYETRVILAAFCPMCRQKASIIKSPKLSQAFEQRRWHFFSKLIGSLGELLNFVTIFLTQTS